VCIEINRAEAEGLFEEAERRKDVGRREGGRGKKKNLTVTSPESFETRQIIAIRAGVGEQTVQRAITIKRKRPDLYQRLFNGYDENGKEVKIGTVYAQMKRDELTKGQRACIVLNSDEAQRIAKEAKERQEQAGERGKEGGRGNKKPLPTNDGKGKRDRDRQTAYILGSRAGVSGGQMERLMAVKRNRPDIYLKVFAGYDENGREYTIGRAHAEMKRDEAIANGETK
jgi:hypothetical protein